MNIAIIINYIEVKWTLMQKNDNKLYSYLNYM